MPAQTQSTTLLLPFSDCRYIGTGAITHFKACMAQKSLRICERRRLTRGRFAFALGKSDLFRICTCIKFMGKEIPMRFEGFSFGSIRINGTTYEHDVVIDRGHVRKRKKKPSKKFRDTFGHTPLSIEEDIPWKCQRLVIGTGTGALPVMEEVKREADRRKIKLEILPTAGAIKKLKEDADETNAILHVTC
jgi:hypothetical protein